MRNELDMAFNQNQNQLKFWTKYKYTPKNSLRYWVKIHKKSLIYKKNILKIYLF